MLSKLKNKIVIYKWVYLIFYRDFKTTIDINLFRLFYIKKLGIGGKFKLFVNNLNFCFRSIICK